MKRGLYTTEAVILNSFDYGESDRILAFCSSDYGKIKGIAKGARRSKKRFVGNLEPASHVRLDFFSSEKSELVRVEQVTLLDAMPGLRADMERYGAACCMLETVSEMTREGLSLPRVFSLLLSFVKMAAQLPDAAHTLSFFEIKLLDILGFSPHLESCVACRLGFGSGHGEDARIFFSSEKGGALCPDCAAGASMLVPVTIGTARFLIAALRFDNELLARLKPNGRILKEGGALLDDFIAFQTGKELKAKKFLAKLKCASV
ncbi:DNA repair protein RecO [bacterium]|nr:MAG: DNA repair protein RecO [bacterium]